MIDQLAQFKQWKWIDIQRTAEEEKKDKEYNEPLKVSFQEQKSRLAESLYWSFKPNNYEKPIDNSNNTELIFDSSNLSDSLDNKDKNNSELQNQDINNEKLWNNEMISNDSKVLDFKEQEKADLSKFKEDPNYPILERFTKIQWNDWKILDSTYLTDKDLLWISKVLNQNESEDPLKYLKNNLSKIDFKNSNTMIFLWKYLDKIIYLNKDKKESKNDWWDEKLALPEEFKNNQVLNRENDDIVQLLIKNHTKLPDTQNWEPNFNKDILTTFEITANKLIEWKNFPRNDVFDLVMKDVKNWDLETRYNALWYIHNLVNTSEWIKWERNESYSENSLDDEFTNQEELDWELAKMNSELIEAKNKWDNKKIKEIQEQIISIDKDKSSWEVFEWWKIDKVSDKSPQISKNV